MHVHCSGGSDVHRLRGADLRQVHPEGSRPVLALALSQVLRLPRPPQRQVLLQGRRRLLQGRLLPVSRVNITAFTVPSRSVLLVSEQQLSYRKQIARQLRTQFVEGITVTLKST